MKKLTVLLLGLTSLIMPTIHAALIEGQINNLDEYQWNTTSTDSESKWYTKGGYQEFNDASGGDPWDINYLGVDIQNGDFQFGAIGGSILSGSNTYSTTTLTLSDIAINVLTAGETLTDPASDSTGWDYALHLDGINTQGDASFSLYALGDQGHWEGSGTGATVTDLYNHQDSSYGSTNTFNMVGGDLIQSGIIGKYSPNLNDPDAHVLEGSFDLSLLSLFDENAGGKILTYLTMSCANDEAIVVADVSAVPVPAAIWLFGSALLGFIGISRRTKV